MVTLIKLQKMLTPLKLNNNILMYRILNQKPKYRRLGLLVFFLSFSVFSKSIKAVLPGEINGVKLDFCNGTNCLLLSSPKIVIGLINGNYAFSNIKASVKIRDTNKEYNFDAEEAYLDQNSSLLFIRKLKAPFVGQEVMINTKSLILKISKSI